MIQSSVSNLLLVLVFVFLGLWALSVVSRMWFAYQSYRCLLKSRSSKANFLAVDVAQLFAGVPLRQVIEEQEATRRSGAHILMHTIAIPVAPGGEGAAGWAASSQASASPSTVERQPLQEKSGDHLAGVFEETGKIWLKVRFTGFRLSGDLNLHGSLVQLANNAAPHEIVNGLRCRRSLRMLPPVAQPTTTTIRSEFQTSSIIGHSVRLPSSQMCHFNVCSDETTEAGCPMTALPQQSREAVEEGSDATRRRQSFGLLTVPVEPLEWENAQNSTTANNVDSFLWVDVVGASMPLSLVYHLTLVVQHPAIKEARSDKRVEEGDNPVAPADVTLIDRDNITAPVVEPVEASSNDVTKLADVSLQLAYVMSGHRLFQARAVFHLRESGDDDKELCLVCFASTKATIFIPCGHYACCLICTRKLRHCPICRTEVAFTVCVLRDALLSN